MGSSAVFSAVMCSFGARFLYPKMGYEGHSFRVLGLSPVSMGRVLMAQFILTAGSLMVISMGLMLISSRMLPIGNDIRDCPWRWPGYPQVGYLISGLVTT